VIIVTGTGRSGTSLVAGVLVKLGVKMGIRFVPANSTNVYGHWEDVEFHDLNEARLNQKISSDEFIDKLRSLALNKVEPWGIKDPRISDLLVEYKTVFPNAKFIVCERDREGVVTSLMKAYGWSRSVSIDLYERRSSALVNIDALRVLFNERNDLVDRVSDFVGMPPTAQACSFVRPLPNGNKDNGRPSVYITVPNGKGWLHKHVHFAVCRMLGDSRYRVRHDCPTHSPYVHNLHKCMNDFLNGEEDYWLSIDNDNPPTNNPLDLVNCDCDLIGFPTPVWHSAIEGDRPWYFNAVDSHKDGYTPHEPCEGLQEVDAIGSGCFLVSRRVMYALRDEQPFMRDWGQDGLVKLGGDYSFCRKVKKAGFRIFAHFDYPCLHFNEIEIGEVIRAFGAMQAREVV